MAKLFLTICWETHPKKTRFPATKPKQFIELKLLKAWKASRKIDLTESFTDLCCTSPDVRFLGGRHPKYWKFRLSMQAMHSGYPLRLCIQAIHSGYPFRLSIQAIQSGYPFRLSIQATHSAFSPYAFSSAHQRPQGPVGRFFATITFSKIAPNHVSTADS